MYIWRGRAHTNSRHELTGLSTRTQNFEKCSYLSQNHFGSALSQFSSTWLFVFQLTGDSGAPLKQCFADLKYQFSLFQIDCGSNGWSRQNLWFWLIFGRPAIVPELRHVWFKSSPTVFLTTSGPSMQTGAILQCSFVHVWIRLQVKQSVAVLHWCHLSGSSACKSEIKKELIEILSFIWKINKHKIAIPNSWKYFWFEISLKGWNIHREKITKPTILTSTLCQSE